MMTNQTNLAAKKINDANKTQTAQSLIIKAYANSVLHQPDVDFSGFDNLTRYQSEINNGLAIAKKHANDFLNTVEPRIIKNISNIGNYYATHNAVADTVPSGSSTREWIKLLSVLKDESAEYESTAKDLVTKLQDLRSNLTTDESAFAAIVTHLNAAVNGDKGILDSINDELSSIQRKINGAIAGVVVSGVCILLGGFIIAVGSISNFVTAGTSTPLVAGGVAILVAGASGEAASSAILGALNSQKATLLLEKSKLKAEVNLALGISNAYGSIGDQLSRSVKAAMDMQDAWTFLNADLDSLVRDLEKGIVSADNVQKMWLRSANKQITAVTTDINNIKKQMAGVKVVVAEKGTTVGDAIRQAAQAG
ncbi:MAG: HBL/NHE enterotoxin family protein [Candidatus Thiodiazotropha sp.]